MGLRTVIYVDKHKTFPQALLKVCQFPAEFSDGRGGVIRKPIEW